MPTSTPPPPSSPRRRPPCWSGCSARPRRPIRWRTPTRRTARRARRCSRTWWRTTPSPRTEADEAKATPLGANDRTEPATPTAAWPRTSSSGCDSRRWPRSARTRSTATGLRVVTTLDLDAQAAAEKAVADVLTDPAGNRRPRSSPSTRTGPCEPTSAAATTTTLEGRPGPRQGRRRFRSPARLYLQALRPPGRPRATGPRSPTGSPARRRSRSTSTAPPSRSRTTAARGSATSRSREATASSVNTVYAQLLAAGGPGRRGRAAHEAAASTPSSSRCRPSRSGCEEVSPLDLASAYLTFADDGTRVEPYAIAASRTATATSSGSPTARNPRRTPSNPRSPAPSPRPCAASSRTAPAPAADIGRPAAGKTGTTQNNVDAWFAGYVPGYTAVVWMGYPGRRHRDGRR